jgi:hypothetical protein
MAHEADEGRAPDDVGGRGRAEQSIVRRGLRQVGSSEVDAQRDDSGSKRVLVESQHLLRSLPGYDRLRRFIGHGYPRRGSASANEGRDLAEVSGYYNI